MNSTTRATISVTLCSLLSVSAIAATHEYTYYMDTASGRPQSGHTWAIERFVIGPFSPTAGDTLILHIQFDRPLLVEELAGPELNERVQILLDSGASSSGGVDALSYGTFSFPDATGSLLTPTVGWSTDSGGFGIVASRSINLTNSSFTFSHLDVTWNLSTFYFVPPSSEFQYIWVTFDADRISVVPISIDERLSQLLDEVTGIGPGRSLADKVVLAATYYAAQDTQSACGVLDAVEHQLKAIQGKMIDDSLASDLMDDVANIQGMIGCE